MSCLYFAFQPVLFLLVASSLSTPLDSWEGSKGWEDQNSWRSVKAWEDNLNWNNKKNLKDQKGWVDEMGLENKNWDSLSDSTILVETHNWFVNICHYYLIKLHLHYFFHQKQPPLKKIAYNNFFFYLKMNL